MDKVSGKWRNNMAFDLQLDELTIPVDSDPAFGGSGYGPRPKDLMLTALAGCTGMDVVSIMGKMKVPFTGLRLEIAGEKAETHPKVYTKVHVTYVVSGSDLPREKVQRAVDLSLNEYCGVAATLKKTAELTHEIIFDS